MSTDIFDDLADLQSATAIEKGDYITSGFLMNDSGKVRNCLNEKFWLDAFSRETDVRFELISNSFWNFEDGLWKKITTAQVLEDLDCFIRSKCPRNAAFEAGIPLDKVLKGKTLAEIVRRLQGKVAVDNLQALEARGVVLVRNGRLEIDAKGNVSFTAGDRGRLEDYKVSRLEVSYDPEAKCPAVENWLSRIFRGRQDDIEQIYRSLGVALWGKNPFKRMIVIEGEADLGKSQVGLLASYLAGAGKWVSFRSNKLGEKFEAAAFLNKSLLLAAEMSPNAWQQNEGEIMKTLTGNDPIPTRMMYQTEPIVQYGDKLIIATMNKSLILANGGSAEKRRLIILKADGQAIEEDQQNASFASEIIKDEVSGAGLLNLALAGLKSVLEVGFWARSERQDQLVEKLVKDSQAAYDWVDENVELSDPNTTPAGYGLSISDAWSSYVSYCHKHDIAIWSENTFRKEIKDIIQRRFGKTESHSVKIGERWGRGWHGLTLVSREPYPTPAAV
jgi:phage/plasmid-associated DNA primase